MDYIQSLNGIWGLWFGPDEGKKLGCRQEAEALGYRKIEAQVPGNVELDLIRAGLAEDPFVGDNVLDFEQYEQYAWWFERSFNPKVVGQGRRAVLVLHGINTYADIFVNGIRVGTADNMMIAHEFDISKAIDWTVSNTVAVAIRSAMMEARKKPMPVAQQGNDGRNEMPLLRMPPHSFGWDIMPRLLSSGLWRDVTIEYRNGERFTDLYLYTHSASVEEARLMLCCVFESDQVHLPAYTVRISGQCGESIFEASRETCFVSRGIEISVPHPCLWWPAGYGEAPLYDVSVTLLQGERVCDERTFRFGIRTATVDACFDRNQGRFTAVVNGENIFIRGSNWVPLSALHSLDKERTPQAVDMLAACGVNAVRCWGGNVYESDAFYDLCDEKGILVWQDFSMACAVQPQDDMFAVAVEKEAVSVIRRLRNHPSLLLWAGDNEVDETYADRYPRGHARYNRITREVLPRVCAAHDPMRYYLPSSPYIPADRETHREVPEQHLWGPRDDFKGDFIRLNTARLASEIGYHGCPAVSSIKKFITEDELWPMSGSRQWLIHNTDHPQYQRSYDRNELMAKQVAIFFGQVPEDIETFAFASQVSQAEAKKFFIEQFRMKKWDKTGIFWWNLIDGWPQTSDAVVDYYYHAKLAYHIITRSQRPIQLMMDEYKNWHHDVWAVNDTLAEVMVACQITDGETRSVLLEKDGIIPRNGRLHMGKIKANPAKKQLYILSWTVNNQQYYSHYMAGQVPFDINQVRKWVKIIADLTPCFDAEDCWR